MVTATDGSVHLLLSLMPTCHTHMPTHPPARMHTQTHLSCPVISLPKRPRYFPQGEDEGKLVGKSFSCSICEQITLIFGIQWLGMQATWPSHSSLRLVISVVTVTGFPQRSRVIAEEMCCSRCCLLRIPSTVQMHRWWKASSPSGVCAGESSTQIHTEEWTSRRLCTLRMVVTVR